MNTQTCCWVRNAVVALLVSGLSACGGSSGGGSDEPANVAPKMADWSIAADEKAAVQIASTATDEDGTISQYSWSQASGPSVSLTGTTSNTLQFTAPALTAPASLVFNHTATDNDGASVTAKVTVTVNPVQLSYLITGKVVGDGYADATVSTDVDGQTFTTTADADGSYELTISRDDDAATDIVASITANSPTRPELGLRALLLNFADMIPATKTSMLDKLGHLFGKAGDPNLVDVSSVSTALYSLIVEQNGGIVPTDISSLNYVEKSIDPDLLIEAAAVIQILIDNPNIALPNGVSSVVELLSNNDAYNTLVTTIETDSPGLIASTGDAIVNDPALTPPLDEADVPESYIRTYAAAPTFLSRGGERYQFNSDGSGFYTYDGGRSTFAWAVVDGDIEISFSPALSNLSYPSTAVGIAGLSQSDVDTLLANNIFQVEVTISTTSQTLHRLTDGSMIDTYRLTSNDTITMTPRVVNGQTIAPAPVTDQPIADALMKDGAAVNAIAFTEADLLDEEFALYRYHDITWSDGSTRTGFYAQTFWFATASTGVASRNDPSDGVVTEDFSWSVANNELVLTFADGSKMSYLPLDQDGDDYSVLAMALDSNDEPVAAYVDYGIKLNEAFDFLTGDASNPDGYYWQTTINQWDLADWNQGRMTFCSADDCSSNSFNYFGWELHGDGGGYNNSRFTELPPNFAPIHDNASLIGWSVDEESMLHIDLMMPNWRCFDGSLCSARNWYLLNVRDDGAIGQRIYVYEDVTTKLNWDAASTENGFAIGPRINMYEEIPYSYWNETSNSQTGVVSKAGALTGKKVLAPTAQAQTRQ